MGHRLPQGHCVESSLRIEIEDEPLLFCFIEIMLILGLWDKDGLGRMNTMAQTWAL